MTARLSVSVVIPARNAAATICETLVSVCACRGVTQIVVVDDASTDDTRAKALSIDDPRIEIVSGPGTGISGALNAGFAAMRAEYVMRCDADDLVPADRLEWQVPILADNPGLIAVSAGFATMLDDGTPCGKLACGGEKRDVTDMLKSGQTVTSFCTWLTRCETITKVGGARDWFRTAEDVDLQYRLGATGRVLHVPRVSYVYRMHDRSIVHSTSNSARAFFDDHAAEFVLDRVKTGSDTLDRGDPLPDWPKPEQGQTRSAFDQGVAHVLGLAWSEADMGQYRTALKHIGRLLVKAPTNRRLLKNFSKIAFRGIIRSTGLQRRKSD